FDVMFVDQNMNRMNGDVAIAMLRQQGIHTPAFALTGMACDDEDLEHLLAAGFDTVLTKPLTHDAAITAVRRFVYGELEFTQQYME
ncbi:response regulator, partial [archaeon]